MISYLRKGHAGTDGTFPTFCKLGKFGFTPHEYRVQLEFDFRGLPDLRVQCCPAAAAVAISFGDSLKGNANDIEETARSFKNKRETRAADTEPSDPSAACAHKSGIRSRATGAPWDGRSRICAEFPPMGTADPRSRIGSRSN